MRVRGAQTRQCAFGVAAVFTGFANVLAGGPMVAAHAAELSPAQTVAQRFPTAWTSAAGTSVSPEVAKPSLATRGTAPVESTRGITLPESTRNVTARPTSSLAAALATAQMHPADLYFNPNPAMQPAASASAPSAPMAYAAPAAPAPTPAAAKPAYQLASASSVPEKRPEPHRPVAARSNFVFSDGQIASMKERLNLTPAQERMWPQVEVALRGLVFQKPVSGEKKSARTLDPSSPEVAKLKSAAVPLVLSFNSEQQRELRALAHVVGLDSLAMSF